MVFKKYPELLDASKKCQVALPYLSYDPAQITLRLNYIKSYLKDNSPGSVDEILKMLETVKGIREDLGF